MPSTPSPLLKFEVQETGENQDLWGTKANEIFKRIAEAVAGEIEVDIAGMGDLALSDDQYVASQARRAILKLTGALTGARTIVVPARSKVYFVNNAATGAHDVTVMAFGGTGMVIPRTGWSLVIADAAGAEVVNFGATAADPAFSTLVFNTNLVWDVAAQPRGFVTLTDDVTGLTVENAVDPGVYTLVIRQDGTGGRAFPFPAAWSGPGGSIESGANVFTILTIRPIGNVIVAAPLWRNP